MKRIVIALVLIFVTSVPVLGQTVQAEILECLTIPEPQCGIHWGYQHSFFRAGRANPRMRLEDLKKELEKAVRKNNETRAAIIKLDMAYIYSWIDSIGPSQRCTNEAYEYLKYRHSFDPKAEIAFNIGRAFDQRGNDKEAEIWYERASWSDKDYYPAYFELMGESGFSRKKESLELFQKSQALADRLINSDREPAFRAKVAFEYALTLSNLMSMHGFTEFFEGMLNQIQTPSDSTEFESQMIVLTKKMVGCFCSDEVIGFLQKAAALDPSKTEYRLSFCAADLGRNFFESIDYLVKREKDYPNLSENEVIEIMLLKQREKYLAIREKLLNFSPEEKDRFPAIEYYLAFAHLVLRDHTNAYITINEFIRRKPDCELGYALHCGIAVHYAQNESGITQQMINEIIAVNERKCQNFPNSWDCYRLGVFRLYSGDLYNAITAFESAALLEDKDPSARIALAVCYLKMGYQSKAKGIAGSLGLAGTELGGRELTCCQIINSVIAGLEGNKGSALFWANKAQKEEEGELPELNRLIDLLQRL